MRWIILLVCLMAFNPVFAAEPEQVNLLEPPRLSDQLEEVGTNPAQWLKELRHSWSNLSAEFQQGLRSLAARALSIFLILTTAALIWRGVSRAIGRRLAPRDVAGTIIEPSARVKTLLPVLRLCARLFIGLVAGLMILTELNIDITPLLAGAGVVGLAVGFGSQALVKDFITGLFIILEDTIAIGDVITVGTHSGTVESMTIRTLRLRDLRGGLHVLPFGEVTSFLNQTKDYAFAVMDVNVAYDTDLTKAMNAITQEVQALAATPEFADFVLSPAEVLGVEALGDSAVQLRVRIKLKAGQQWSFRRVFLQQIKARFDADGIKIPYPTVYTVPIPPAIIDQKVSS